MNKKILNLLVTVLKIALAVGLIAYLFLSGKVDLESLKALTTLPVIATGLVSLGLVLYFASERWRLLLRQQQLVAHRWETFRLTLIGTFFNFFVPGGVGGDVVKAVILAREHHSQRGRAVLTVLADRVLGLFTMTFLALLSFGFEPELLTRENAFQFIFGALVALFAGFLVAFWLLLSRHAQGLRGLVETVLTRIPKLKKLWDFAQTYRLSPGELIKLFALSLGAQVGQIILFWVVAMQLTPSPPPASVFFFAVPVGFMVTAVPLAPAGIGIGQAAFFYLFSKASGAETDIGVIGITAFQAFQLCFGLAGAVFFVLLKRKDPRLTVEELETEAQTS